MLKKDYTRQLRYDRCAVSVIHIQSLTKSKQKRIASQRSSSTFSLWSPPTLRSQLSPAGLEAPPAHERQ